MLIRECLTLSTSLGCVLNLSRSLKVSTLCPSLESILYFLSKKCKYMQILIQWRAVDLGILSHSYKSHLLPFNDLLFSSSFILLLSIVPRFFRTTLPLQHSHNDLPIEYLPIHSVLLYISSLDFLLFITSLTSHNIVKNLLWGVTSIQSELDDSQ